MLVLVFSLNVGVSMCLCAALIVNIPFCARCTVVDPYGGGTDDFVTPMAFHLIAAAWDDGA